MRYLVLLIPLLFACGARQSSPTLGHDVTCTAFPSDGNCYCQTTCRSHVQIFTCFESSGDCHCQGFDAQTALVHTKCGSMADAQHIYRECFG